MGDTRRFKKAFAKPFKPWDDGRITEEKGLLREYGLKNKKEIWSSTTMLRKFKAQAKKLIVAKGAQADKERALFLAKLSGLGLASQNSSLDEILGLNINNLLNRRLQTLVHDKKMARTIKQARQFIVQEHILVNGKKIAVPFYIVRKNEEDTITFSPESALSSEIHPERVQKQQVVPEEPKEADAAAEPAKNAEA